MLWNQRGEYFHDLAPSSELLSASHVSRGLAVCDYDDDGDLDLLLVHHGEGVQLLRNGMQRGNWLKVRLRSRAPDGEPRGFAEGARAILRAGEAVLRRTVASASYLSQSCRTLHFGLGERSVADRLEVRWPDGETAVFEGLEAGATWELAQGEPEPRRVASRAVGTEDAKQRLVEFWTTQRAAVRAMKVDRNLVEAIRLFRRALELKPGHEDSLYFLANCLAARGDFAGAVANLEELVRVNSQSHRALRQLATLIALNAESPRELEPAVKWLERALEVNLEETGALLLLGEIELLRDDPAAAERQLSLACRTNPRAAGGFFMLAYIAWREGDAARTDELLEKTREALGEEWKPAGMTAEGDVEEEMHKDRTPLSRFWENWNGSSDPEAAFADLHAHLDKFRR